METFAFIVLMVTHEDNAGNVASVVAVKALFFKKVRLLSMGVFPFFDVITMCFNHLYKIA
jgi:hypothetical protein